MNTKYIYLSHFISEETPLYGGQSNIRIKKDLRISSGDPANTLLIEIPNHVSTHIDLPKHFSNVGKSLSDYNPSFWFFQNVSVLKVNASPGETIDLTPRLQEVRRDTDLLLVKTGFQKYRHEKMYWENNPGLAPKSAGELRKRCPQLKAVGIDFISVSTPAREDIGLQAHRAFLVENDILLLEDINLESVDSRLQKVYLFPLLIQDADGVPVTAIGEVAS